MAFSFFDESFDGIDFAEPEDLRSDAVVSIGAFSCSFR